MNLPMGFGTLDWSDWIRGVLAAFIGGGATAVSGAFALALNDPKDFNLQAGMFWSTIGTMFAISGVINLMMFLRTKPLPDFKTVTTTTETTKQTTPATQVVKRVEEVQQVPVKTPVVTEITKDPKP